MPHIVVEYSANLDDRIAIEELVRKIHEAALSTGAFEIAAVRTRAARRDVYLVADGDQDNAFVAVQVRIAQGRDEQTRNRIGKIIFDAACECLEGSGDAQSIATSLEVQEIDDTAAFRKNGLHFLVKERLGKTPA